MTLGSSQLSATLFGMAGQPLGPLSFEAMVTVRLWSNDDFYIGLDFWRESAASRVEPDGRVLDTYYTQFFSLNLGGTDANGLYLTTPELDLALLEALIVRSEWYEAEYIEEAVNETNPSRWRHSLTFEDRDYLGTADYRVVPASPPAELPIPGTLALVLLALMLSRPRLGWFAGSRVARCATR